jgi:hypothetical protein
MSGYFYNDGRVREAAGIGDVQAQAAQGPALVLCGPAERRALEESRAYRTRVLAEGPRGNALLRVEDAGLRVR